VEQCVMHDQCSALRRLGVGSSLAAFDTAYGKGEVITEEGESVRLLAPTRFGYSSWMCPAMLRLATAAP